MLQMTVSAEVVHAPVGRIAEAGTRAASALPEECVRDAAIGIVDDAHGRTHRSRKNVRRHGDHAIAYGHVCAVYIFSEMSDLRG